MGALLNRRRYMGGGGGTPLPYDAEIEYIRCTKSQYINTNIQFNGVEDFEIVLDFCPNSYYDYNAILCVGTGLTNESWLDRSGKFYFRFSDRKFELGAMSIARHVSRFSFKNGVLNCYIDDVQKGSHGISPTSVTDPLWLFHREKYADLDCYAFAVSQNDIKVADYIPVRVGQTGYMYDKVSGQLFGNSGTGDFVLGPDKN